MVPIPLPAIGERSLVSLMSISVVVLPNISFLFGGKALLVLLVSALGFLASTSMLLIRRRRAWAMATTGFAGLVASAFLASYVVPSNVWPAILSAYQAAPPSERAARGRQLAASWDAFNEELHAHKWLMLALDWGVCHELWHQSDCTPAPANREAQGIAREILTQVARGG